MKYLNLGYFLVSWYCSTFNCIISRKRPSLSRAGQPQANIPVWPPEASTSEDQKELEDRIFQKQSQLLRQSLNSPQKIKTKAQLENMLASVISCKGGSIRKTPVRRPPQSEEAGLIVPRASPKTPKRKRKLTDSVIEINDTPEKNKKKRMENEDAVSTSSEGELSSF